MALPGDAVPQLRRGELAPLGAGLRGIRVVLTPGTLGLIECSLSYPDAAAAASAEGTALSVTLAFRHRLEAAIAAGKGRGADAGAPRASGALDWLGAAKVERVGASVLIRAPIPKRWLDDLARAEVAAPPP
jgi:hypothetical protein